MRPVREAVAKLDQHNGDEKLTSLRSTSITDFQVRYGVLMETLKNMDSRRFDSWLLLRDLNVHSS